MIEGADGVGSTTQCAALVDGLRLAGRTAIMTAEPSKGPIGVVIRQLLSGERPRTAIHRELALLFAADRLDHIAREVEPNLAAGTDVVSDRYTLSSLVYQSLDLPLEWVRDLNRYAPRADCTILISVPPEESWARLEARLDTGAPREVFDQKTTQSRIHGEYERQARKYGAIIVDGRGAVSDVSARVRGALQAIGQWPA